MATKLSKLKRQAKALYMFPTLHHEITKTVSSDISKIWFSKKSDEANKEYSTHVMGKFRCDNGDCSNHGWSSKKIAILIRGFSGNGYNAVVFNQRCQSCNQLGSLMLDKTSYIERVSYRLKKWAGVKLEGQPHAITQGLPHKPELCEGCKRGYCQNRITRGDSNEASFEDE
ncbi:hypothetical protein M426DRAFT_325527 [Hypoxylon sp. CI-4A]|nr:hypothetical protein M426DRAFT_325527 [Hypoxylon sp. CI-4A]